MAANPPPVWLSGQNTAQTTVNWVTAEPWFALKTKGANGRQLGNALLLVGSKNNEGTPLEWVSQVRWFPQEQERQTGEAWVSAFFWFAAGIKEAAWPVWVSVSFWLPQVILRVTACTGRTLVFLSRMVSKRYLPGYRRWLGLLKGEAETRNFWVSAFSLVSAGIRRQRGRLGYRFILSCRKSVTQAKHVWVS